MYDSDQFQAPGNLVVNGQGIPPSQLGSYNKSSLALGSSLFVASGMGLLYGFSVFNSKAASQFLLFFDQTSTPGSGAVPNAVWTMAATANLGVNWFPPRAFYSGCWLANSSTSATLTAGSADCWFDVQYWVE